jgi:tartrate-resistant acid phosphatase type 5
MKGIAGILIGVFLAWFFTADNACNKKYAYSNAPWDTLNLTGDSVSFLVMGDWGQRGAYSQKAVADQMDLYSRKFHARFIITTGDNFYPAGVSSITDTHWASSFENIYNKEGHKIPWYPVLGNHDYGSNPQAEVQYSSVSNRWKMPARYYEIERPIDSASSVLFTFTDTSPFVTAYHGGGMSDLSQQDTAAQLKWLQQTLSTSNNTWKIVVGHHPVYSVGPHGNTPELIQRFKPLFNQTHTDFYICGHDHSLQYLRLPGDPVHYLVSGGGSETTTVDPKSYTPFARATPGFMVMTLYARRANFYFYNQRGELIYRNQILK